MVILERVGNDPHNPLIVDVRGLPVILDYELAKLYKVETKNLKRAVKSNMNRFPEDFMFELTKEEFDSLRCKKFTSKGRGGTRCRPWKECLLI